MKIALIGINSNLIQTNAQEKIIKYIKEKLYEIGENITLISYFDNNQEILKNIINDKYNIIFFIGTESAIYNHNIKDNLSRIFGDRMIDNNSCIANIKKYCANHNITFSMQEELEVKSPSKAIALSNDSYFGCGFMYKYYEQYIVFLPSNLNFAMKNYNDYILPLIRDISTNNLDCFTIRCYGILEKDIRTLISEELGNSNITIQILNKRLDNTIYIRFKKSFDIQPILSLICSKLNKFIYSMEDTDLYNTAKYLLNLHKKQLVIAETITLGNISKNLSLTDNNLVSESYLFNHFDTISKNLNLDEKIINNYGKYSVNTVYELDNLLLEKSNADIAIFVLGDLSLDTCYMAIGDIDGIHVYKNKIISIDDELIDNISDTALFYLIKKLRQNDLQFR